MHQPGHALGERGARDRGRAVHIRLPRLGVAGKERDLRRQMEDDVGVGERQFQYGLVAAGR